MDDLSRDKRLRNPNQCLVLDMKQHSTQISLIQVKVMIILLRRLVI